MTRKTSRRSTTKNPSKPSKKRQKIAARKAAAARLAAAKADGSRKPAKAGVTRDRAVTANRKCFEGGPLKPTPARLVINVIIPAVMVILLVIGARSESYTRNQILACAGLIAAAGVLLFLPFKLHRLPGIILMLLVAPASFYLIEAFSHSGFSIYVPLQLLNIAVYLLILLLIFFLTGRSRIAAIAAAVWPMAIGIANFYTVRFRSTPILPWDLLSIRTALSVTATYTFAIEWRMLVVAFGFVVLIILGARSSVRLPKKGRSVWICRLAAAAAMAAGLMLIYTGLQNTEFKQKLKLEETLFTPNVIYRDNGFAVSFIYDAQYIHVKKPAGYSLKAVAEIMAPYMDDGACVVNAGLTGQADVPNVLVIMNEAFSDLAVLGEFSTNVDYMPFFNSLQTNTQRGWLHVSVKGGNTANTEYEFLTGDSLAFLPVGSVAFQQYIHRPTASMASYMDRLGYDTYGIHPYYASGWDRDEVYPFFGFETSLFKNAFKDPKIIRKYISDESAFDKLIELYENKASDARLFAFEVTMQNHGGYYQDYDDFDPEVALTFEADTAAAQHYSEQYLSLILESDRAFEQLIKYFEGESEKTVIVMFGDHQPADIIARPVQKLNGTYGDESLAAVEDRYIVPYVIWANYDMEEASDDVTSVNYIGARILEAAGLPLTGYQRFLMDMRESVPVLTCNAVIGRDGQIHPAGNWDELDEEAQEWIRKYQILQYYHLFDKDMSLKDFYGGVSGE